MPLNASGWTSKEDENLAKLVEPHSLLYNVLDPSRNNILAREKTWQKIAKALSRSIEDCKKRWRGLRDGYMRSKRVGAIHKTKTDLFEKLQFLNPIPDEIETEGSVKIESQMEDDSQVNEEVIGQEQHVITDNQEYYEITVVDGPQEQIISKPFLKILPTKVTTTSEEPPIKIAKKNSGRKKRIPLPKSVAPPVKILPKPLLMNPNNIIRYIEDTRTEQRSETIDKLIEKVLKENTNEIDVFFRSMAASVKKLQPNLIPKVKMEVCNVIAKYEMQSFDRS